MQTCKYVLDWNGKCNAYSINYPKTLKAIVLTYYICRSLKTN